MFRRTIVDKVFTNTFLHDIVNKEVAFLQKSIEQLKKENRALTFRLQYTSRFSADDTARAFTRVKFYNKPIEEIFHEWRVKEKKRKKWEESLTKKDSHATLESDKN